ncbi:MAG: hypothetical protein WC482_06015 [Candidatus Omnitrophota bacterium]
MTKDRVLLSALVFSVAWHLFWLSALTVVVTPKDTKPPKFSSVSFLGPILRQSTLEVNPAVHERSIPEKRYLSEIENSYILLSENVGLDTYAEAGLDAGTDLFEFDETLVELAILTIDGSKMEPGNSQ